MTGEEDLENLDVKERFKEMLSKENLAEKVLSIVDILIPACVVKPKVVAGPAAKGELSVDELEFEDIFALFDEILSFSGLTEESYAERIKFRSKRAR